MPHGASDDLLFTHSSLSIANTASITWQVVRNTSRQFSKSGFVLESEPVKSDSYGHDMLYN